jgi:membrane protein required for colicin V production
MGFIDIVLGALLAFGIFKGLRNGLIVEFASLISFFIGVLIAVKFSHFIGDMIGDGSSKTIKVIAFVLTFILVVVGIFLLAKVISKIASAMLLGGVNTIGGAVLGALRTTLMVGVVLCFFQKININNMLVSKQTQEKSFFFNPMMKTSEFMLPMLTNWFKDLGKKALK